MYDAVFPAFVCIGQVSEMSCLLYIEEFPLPPKRILGSCRRKAFLKWRQPERIAAVLDPENAHEETVHSKDDTRPDDTGNLLRARVLHAGHLEAQSNGCEGENGICSVSLAEDRKTREVPRGLTDRGHNLGLHPVLGLEAVGEVHDLALVASHVWYLPNVIEHVSTGEQEDCNQADRGP